VDLFIGFLDGSLHTRTDDQITEALLASHTPRPADAAHRRPSRREGPARATATGRSGGPGAPAGSGRPRSEEPDTDTHSTRDLVRAHQSAPWRYALPDTDGRLIHAGTLRRRPTVDDIAPATTTADARAAAHTPIPPADPAAPGLVDLLVDATLLQHLTTDPAAVPPSWRPVLNEITNSRGRPLDDAPGDRFPHAALRRHVEFRDRTCTFTGCLAPAHRTDLDHTRDHTRDHAHGGPTTADDLGPACRHDHGLKQRGWTLTQPEPGVFVWRSPLGREYRTRADPLLPPPPPPLPVSDEDDACCADPLDDLDRSQPLIVWRPATDDHDDEPRPPPHPITELDDEPPF
ncbi:HNH endonuclease signature motif containing protein, partial [Pseudonocardia sp. NPDC049154]|uniref:HNH endonuclease signature motif containing protein n=1 Tax=Pseudonocardia sp. NPDC049154 TaxID=3155501 RepID=UPI0033E49B38